MSVLKTTQTIKVKVNADGGLQPLATNTPVVLKNTVREDIKLSQLADVVANTAANGAYLVYNSTTGKYEVKIVDTTLESISNFDSAPTGAPASNGDIVVFNTTTNKYEVRPLTIALGDLTDVNANSPANGYVLVYNAATTKYDVKQLSTTVSSLLDVQGTPVDGATLVYNAAIGKYEVKIIDSVPSVNGTSTPITIKVSSEIQPSNLISGELAYSNTISALYIGNDVLSTLIAGEKFVYIQRAVAGQLTPNSALIVDGNSFIDSVKTSSIEVGASGSSNLVTITSISNFANSSQLGNFAYGSNSELVTSAAIKNYIDEVVATGVSGNVASPYVLPIATSSTLGGVKIGSGLSIDAITGVLSATGGAGGYVLPTASAGTIGGIRIGSGLVIDPDGVVSVAGPGGNVGVTVEGAQDAAANLFLHNQHTGISFVYDDVNNRIIATATGTPGATNLNGLTDVTLSLVSNNSTLVYDNVAGQWKNYSLQGTNNQVDVLFTAGAVRVGLPNNVTVAANLTIGNTITVAGPATISGNAVFNSNVNIDQALKVNSTSFFSNVVVVNSSLEVSNYANFANTVSVARSLSVTRQASFSNTVNVVGTLAVGNNVTITGNASVTNVLTSANVVSNNLSVVNGLLSVTGNTTLVGTTTIHGNTTIGNTSLDVVTINAELGSSIIPAANNIYSLGSADRRFKDVYVSGGTIFVDEVQLSSPPGGGLAVEGPLAVNGHANVNGNLSVSSSATIQNSINVVGNTIVGTTSNDIIVINSSLDSSFVPATHNTHSIGSSSKQFANLYAVNINGHDASLTGNLFVTGDFTVLGNVSTLSVTTVEVEDSLLKIAANNTSDIIDQGFYGKAIQGPTTIYSGIARDASDGKFKVFTTSAEPTATVDTSDPSFKISTLVSYLESGGLISNSSNIAINSNGSITVTIVANTLSLSTPLGVSSGGTGRNTFTNNAVLYGNGTNALQQAIGLDGQILHIANGVPTFGYIDSGYY